MAKYEGIVLGLYLGIELLPGVWVSMIPYMGIWGLYTGCVETSSANPKPETLNSQRPKSWGKGRLYCRIFEEFSVWGVRVWSRVWGLGFRV